MSRKTDSQLNSNWYTKNYIPVSQMNVYSLDSELE